MDTSKIFNSIAGDYNLFNHLFSFNLDKSWRKELLKRLEDDFLDKPKPDILDVACGTGDLTIAEAKKGFKVTGIDISDGMLQIARGRIAKESEKFDFQPQLLKENASDMSFKNDSFDAVTMGYGIRNFDDRQSSLNEIYRVLKPNGKLYILEFGEPSNRFMRFVYHIYFQEFMPFSVRLLTFGKLGKEYRYFVQSVKKFPKFESFCKEIEAAGFKNVTFKRQTNGISVLYTADKGC